MSKLPNQLSTIFSSAIVALATVSITGSTAFAELGKFTSIDFPGAVSTGGSLRFLGINAQGDIVGTYQTADGKTHGFLLRQGEFTTIDHPTAPPLTFANGINAQGDIAGAYLAPPFHAYLLRKGIFELVDPKGALIGAAFGINDRGDIVGLFNTVSTNLFTGSRGFVLHNGVVTPIAFPGATYTWAVGINAVGDIVGRYQSSDGRLHGYLLQHGIFQAVDVPGSAATATQGINAKGEIVGSYQNALPDGTWHGFLLRGEELIRIDFPGARETFVFGINSRGDIVGAYVDAGLRTHGFLLSR